MTVLNNFGVVWVGRGRVVALIKVSCALKKFLIWYKNNNKIINIILYVYITTTWPPKTRLTGQRRRHPSRQRDRSFRVTLWPDDRVCVYLGRRSTNSRGGRADRVVYIAATAFPCSTRDAGSPPSRHAALIHIRKLVMHKPASELGRARARSIEQLFSLHPSLPIADRDRRHVCAAFSVFSQSLSVGRRARASYRFFVVAVVYVFYPFSPISSSASLVILGRRDMKWIVYIIFSLSKPFSRLKNAGSFQKTLEAQKQVCFFLFLSSRVITKVLLLLSPVVVCPYEYSMYRIEY